MSSSRRIRIRRRRIRVSLLIEGISRLAVKPSLSLRPSLSSSLGSISRTSVVALGRRRISAWLVVGVARLAVEATLGGLLVPACSLLPAESWVSFVEGCLSGEWRTVCSLRWVGARLGIGRGRIRVLSVPLSRVLRSSITHLFKYKPSILVPIPCSQEPFAFTLKEILRRIRISYNSLLYL